LSNRIFMNKPEHKEEIETLDKEISSITSRLEKEKRNLVDSGFIEDTNEYNEIFFLIWVAYYAELFPFILKKHHLRPYSGDELKKWNEIYSYYDIHFESLLIGGDFKELLEEMGRIARGEKTRRE